MFPNYTATMIAEAVDRQTRHRAAKTDGDSPYYPNHCWDADLWRQDVEAILSDYFSRVRNSWVASPRIVKAHDPASATGASSALQVWYRWDDGRVELRYERVWPSPEATALQEEVSELHRKAAAGGYESPYFVQFNGKVV